jgi:hypothetical protein
MRESIMQSPNQRFQSTPICSQYNAQHPESLRAARLAIINEAIRQAHLSFNLSFGMNIATAALALTSVGLLLMGKVSEATVVAVCSATSSIGCTQLVKEANTRLERRAIELDSEA